MLTLVLLLGLSSAIPRPAGEHTQRIDYDDNEVVEGTTARGEGELMLARKQAQFGKLIRLRTDFVPELLRSAEGQ
jgi:hypothetical protein